MDCEWMQLQEHAKELLTAIRANGKNVHVHLIMCTSCDGAERIGTDIWNRLIAKRYQTKDCGAEE